MTVAAALDLGVIGFGMRVLEGRLGSVLFGAVLALEASALEVLAVLLTKDLGTARSFSLS